MGAFVAGLHGDAAIADHLAARLVASGAPCGVPRGGRRRRHGGRGRRPLRPLPGGTAEPRGLRRPALSRGRRESAERSVRAWPRRFEHAHLLVFHPRDAAPADLQALLDAGWSTTDIVTLSQLVAFLAFQIRVVAGLRVLAGRP